MKALVLCTALMLGAASPALAAKDLLVIDLPADAATLDPHVQWDTDSYSVYRNIFDNLLTRDTAGKIVGQVATSWTYKSDTQIEFKLRPDIKFHDGSKLTADDVVFSIKRITDRAFNSPQLNQFDSITDAVATDPVTVLVTTARPYPVLLAQLVKLSIVPKAIVQAMGNDKFNQAPVGSGPYRLVAWTKGVKTALAANPDYWGGKPPFPSVEFHAVPDGATRVADLKSGGADLIRGVDPDQANSLKSAPGVQVLSVPTERIGYMFINTQWGPTTDLRVRQAIAYGLDRKLMIDALLGGYGRPVNIVLTPANFGYVDDLKGYPYDPDKARALVKAAGADGKTLIFTTSPVYDQRVVQAIQQMLGDIGLQVEISTSDQATYLKRRQGKPEDAGSISIGNWSCACQDADGVIYPLFQSKSSWSKYANPEYDQVVEQARSVIDPKARLAAYHRAFEILERDVPGIGLYQNVAIYGARKQLKWTPTPNEAMFVKDMSWQD